MATLDRDGVRIYYEDRGSGEVILLTHGYSATSQMWRGQVEDLAADHRVRDDALREVRKQCSYLRMDLCDDLAVLQ